jgi:uncharacterized protein (TIGR00255 family)
MTISMTGFSARKGQGAGHSWTWDIRSVNGKGLDLRLRVPDWIEGLEAELRREISGVVLRGNVSLSLKIAHDAGSDASEVLRLNPDALKSVLKALLQVEEHAMAQGITLRQATSADILLVRGVLDTSGAEIDTAPLRSAIMADLPALLSDFNRMRTAEGTALHDIIAAQLDQITTLTSEAQTQADGRRNAAVTSLQQALGRLIGNAEGLDQDRIAQELALIAVKTDVTEELDRLCAHIAAARTLLDQSGPVGRKFDFLMQEFMREANTLCAKSQSRTLTQVGLDLKTIIDQMREQVQNVE